MKRAVTSSSGKPAVADGLRLEYDLDYTKARPNRFARRIGPKTTVVALDPDVAKFFPDSDSVNEVLRAIIKAFPRRRTGR